MKSWESGEEQNIAWTAILANTPAYSNDDEHVGSVKDVVGAEDIFHGVVISHGTLGSEVLVLAEKVSSITNRRVVVDLTTTEMRKLPPYKPEAVFELGMVGMLRKHLGWVKSRDQDRHNQS